MLLSVSRDRAHRGLDGDRQAGGDRRRSLQARSAAEDGGRAAFLFREEWAQPRGRKLTGRRCGRGDRGVSRPSARSSHPRTRGARLVATDPQTSGGHLQACINGNNHRARSMIRTAARICQSREGQGRDASFSETRYSCGGIKPGESRGYNQGLLRAICCNATARLR